MMYYHQLYARTRYILFAIRSFQINYQVGQYERFNALDIIAVYFACSAWCFKTIGLQLNARALYVRNNERVRENIDGHSKYVLSKISLQNAFVRTVFCQCVGVIANSGPEPNIGNFTGRLGELFPFYALQCRGHTAIPVFVWRDRRDATLAELMVDAVDFM